MTYRVKNVAIAVGLAMVAALMVTFYVSNYKKSVQAGEETVKVWVASRDIAEGTAGTDVLDSSMLKSADVARKDVVPGAISDPKQLDGQFASATVYAGEQVTTLRFRPAEERGIRAQIKGNMRAVQVPGDGNQLLAGIVKEGDHVDVVGSWKYPESAQDHYSRVILRDLLVLKGAESSSVDTKITAQNDSMHVVLRMTDAQSQKFFFVAKNGDWTLQLRPPEDATDSPEGFESAQSLLTDGLNPNQKRGLAAAERSAP